MSIVLPFNTELKDSDSGNAVRARLEDFPAGLQEAGKRAPHLKRYLEMLPVKEVGIPEYYETLYSSLGDIKDPNIIYPVDEQIFVHILVDNIDNRNCYIPIEPSLTIDASTLVKEIEAACIEHGDKLPSFDVDSDRKKQLLDYIDLVTTTDKSGGNEQFKAKAPKSKPTKQLVKVNASPDELAVAKYLFIRDKIGMGELEPLGLDHYIEDISCAGLGPLFIEHKVFKSLKCAITYTEMEDLDNFVLRLAEKLQKPLSFTSPIADSTLPGGSRINIVYGSEISKRGSNFTIRHFSQVPISVFELVNFGTITYDMLAYMALTISNGMNMFVAGESASGKTTMLNALTTFIHPLSKIITIEDTPELQVPHDNWIREVVQTTRAGDNSGVTTFDLLRAALRQRPNEILVGEIRGPEGNVAFQAMQTGHSVMTTFHASTVEKLIQRITSAPILVPKSYIDNLNVVVLMNTVKLPNKQYGRRITSISEIVGYDSLSDSFNIIEVFRWDEETDTYTFTGNMASFILETKIAPRLGIASNKKAQVYSELQKRSRILERLHKDQKVTGFYEVLEVLGKAQKEGLF